MRLALLAMLSIAGLAAGVPAPARATGPFEGAWMSCETDQGARACTYVVLEQRGNRICGMQGGEMGDGRPQTQRLLATVSGNRARIDWICGDPGSETDSYCAGLAPLGAERVGWGRSDQSFFLCNGRLHRARRGEAPSCSAVPQDAGLPRVRGRGAPRLGIENNLWLGTCPAEAEVMGQPR